MSDAEEAVREARRALRSLYIAVAQPVATDVEKRVEAAFTALRAAEAAAFDRGYKQGRADQEKRT